ncbi:hypothetical protein Mapa_001781 [Marchantia paleacea]|nr:hypothetical protein Mapa_001781 [Marchantia paleacea]
MMARQCENSDTHKANCVFTSGTNWTGCSSLPIYYVLARFEKDGLRANFRIKTTLWMLTL